MRAAFRCVINASYSSHDARLIGLDDPPMNRKEDLGKKVKKNGNNGKGITRAEEDDINRRFGDL